MLLRRIARPLLAGVFIADGVAGLLEPKQRAEQAAPVLDPALDLVTGILPIEQPPESTTLIQIDAGIKIGAGVLLAFGKAPRLAAAALAASLVPTTTIQHRFWDIDDPAQRAVHQAHFLKDIGLLGGLLLASADTEGKPSLRWRARRAARTSAATAELLHKDIARNVGQFSQRAATAGEIASSAADRYSDRASEIADRAGEIAGRASEVAGRAGKRARNAAVKAGNRAEEIGAKASERTRKAGRKARTRAAAGAEQLPSELVGR